MSEILNPRLSHFLVNRLGWNKLRNVQRAALELIMGGDDTLIIASTASGKTEAALIPIFNSMIGEGAEPVCLLYVSPLKALINDMHMRMDSWCSHFNLEAMKWHGDVSGSAKKRFIRDPVEVLLITPESLEVILINRTHDEKRRIFRNLRYIIIDEIHYFIEADRGVQLNSLLSRIESYTDRRPQRIGLSATIGNPDAVMDWMSPGGCSLVKSESDRKLDFRIFNVNLKDPNVEDLEELLDILKRLTGRKVLIFSPSRARAEAYYRIIKEKLDVEVFIHHGSLSKDLREDAEAKFKELSGAFMVSTSTLELGIDVGDIDVVVHLSAPASVNQFLQRTGRSGRKRGSQRTIIFTDKGRDVLIALSTVSLALSGKLENLRIPERPLDIYFHQILSSVFELEKPEPSDIYRLLNRSSVFSGISEDYFWRMLKFMMDEDFLRKYGPYIHHGFKFEKTFGRMNFLEFYSVFPPNYEFKVKRGTKTIGTIDAFFAVNYLNKGSLFILGGDEWVVMDIDHERFTVRVKPYLGDADIPRWNSGGMPVSFEVSRHAYDIILGNFNRDLLEKLDEPSRMKIEKYMGRAASYGLKEGMIPVDTDSRISIYTFAGDRVNKLISDIFALEVEKGVSDVVNDAFRTSFVAGIDYSDIVSIMEDIPSIIGEDDFPLRLHTHLNNFVKNKFIRHLPANVAAEIIYELLYNPKDLLNLLDGNRPVLLDGFSLP